MNEPQLFSLPVITPLCAGAKVIQALLSALQSLSTILLRYLCRHVPQLLGKTGALRLQPQSLLLHPFCHPAPKQKVFTLPGQTLPLHHMAEERRRQASLKPWKMTVTPVQHVPLCAHLCLAWPGQTHRHGTGVVAGAASSRLLMVISLAGALCKERRPLRPTGSKRRSPDRTACRGHWLWRGFFTSSSSSTHFFHSTGVFTLLNYKNTLKFLWSSQGWGSASLYSGSQLNCHPLCITALSIKELHRA